MQLLADDSAGSGPRSEMERRVESALALLKSGDELLETQELVLGPTHYELGLTLQVCVCVEWKRGGCTPSEMAPEKRGREREIYSMRE
jgi:hypothetical protein